MENKIMDAIEKNDSGIYSAMGITEAIEEYLLYQNNPKSALQITRGILLGGYRTNSKDLVNYVQVTLRRLKKRRRLRSIGTKSSSFIMWVFAPKLDALEL